MEVDVKLISDIIYENRLDITVDDFITNLENTVPSI
jgi:hypothetical protein